MKSLWSDAEAASFGGSLGPRVYTSRLLGRDKSLVLHGGGNTSVKLRDEVTGYRGVRWAPAANAVRNPAFDVTPAELITGIITERGVVHAPDRETIAALLA